MRRYLINYPQKFVVLIILVSFFLSNTACSLFGTNGDEKPPSAPTGLKGISKDGEISLVWDPSSASDLEGYNIYRSQNSFSNKKNANRIGGLIQSNIVNFDDKQVKNGTTYFYRVTAVDENDNESQLSIEISKTPFPSPPDDP
ncbi:hypothetical protein NC796_26135 [Aliifodinibius sp. S!AR15-10]|uniref:fibronectin type III domain-containing protein n=1 Tax=Aliifodinibius sp. S!AR15-10 TaxID=2950437 RepID=UPI002867017D|nr:hypothetical protein [Aliifodinibius sp. S!AR15-10]MDR8394646.1 hypothetical protein [Aliifodinibius sp. S!AR15-10]